MISLLKRTLVITWSSHSAQYRQEQMGVGRAGDSLKVTSLTKATADAGTVCLEPHVSVTRIGTCSL